MAVRRKAKKKTRAKTKTKARVKKTKRAKRPAKRSAKKSTRKSVKKTTKRRAKAKKTKTKRKSSGLMQMQYHLSAPLADIVGAKKASRPQVVKKLWAYIKAKKLQDSTNRRMINPDQKLGAVLGNRPINMLKMAGALSKHLKKA